MKLSISFNFRPKSGRLFVLGRLGRILLWPFLALVLAVAAGVLLAFWWLIACLSLNMSTTVTNAALSHTSFHKSDNSWHELLAIGLTVLMFFGLIRTLKSARRRLRNRRKHKAAQTVDYRPPELHDSDEPVVELSHETPLRGYKEAYVLPSNPPFRALNAGARYTAVAIATCPVRGSSGERIPHEDDGSPHRCGFYAYDSPLTLMQTMGDSVGIFHRALLEVELYGKVLEGERHVLRGERQRVISVGFRGFCRYCWLRPRRATCFVANRLELVVPACEKHKRHRGKGAYRNKSWTQAELKNIIGTDVRWLSEDDLRQARNSSTQS